MDLKSCIARQVPLKEQQVTASQKRQAHQSSRQGRSPSQTSPWALLAPQVLIICLVLSLTSCLLLSSHPYERQSLLTSS